MGRPPHPLPWLSSASCRPTGGVSALRPERGAARADAEAEQRRACARKQVVCAALLSPAGSGSIWVRRIYQTPASLFSFIPFFSISPPTRLQTEAGAFSASSSPPTEVHLPLFCHKSAFKGASLKMLAHARVGASSQLGLTSGVFGRPRSANHVRGRSLRGDASRIEIG